MTEGKSKAAEPANFKILMVPNMLPGSCQFLCGDESTMMCGPDYGGLADNPVCVPDGSHDRLGAVEVD